MQIKSHPNNHDGAESSVCRGKQRPCSASQLWRCRSTSARTSVCTINATDWCCYSDHSASSLPCGRKPFSAAPTQRIVISAAAWWPTKWTQWVSSLAGAGRRRRADLALIMNARAVWILSFCVRQVTSHHIHREMVALGSPASIIASRRRRLSCSLAYFVVSYSSHAVPGHYQSGANYEITLLRSRLYSSMLRWVRHHL
jgi:hypothetical protein